MSTLVSQAKSSQAPLVYIPLLSTAVDVTIRLKNIKDESLKQIPPSVKVCPSFSSLGYLDDLVQDAIVNLYTTQVLMSKTAVPPYSSVRLFVRIYHPTHHL